MNLELISRDPKIFGNAFVVYLHDFLSEFRVLFMSRKMLSKVYPTIYGIRIFIIFEVNGANKIVKE